MGRLRCLTQQQRRQQQRQQLVLVLLGVACLAAVQPAAAARPVSVGRQLLQPRPLGKSVNATRNQFVQVSWALEGETCQSVANQLKNKMADAEAKFFNNTIAKAVIKDFQSVLTASGWQDAARTVVAVRQPCVTFKFDGVTYASYRVTVRFNSTSTTDVADMMFAGIGTGAGRPCFGGYSRILYKNVAALFDVGSFTVSQNSGNRRNPFSPVEDGSGRSDNWLEYAGPTMSLCAGLRRPSPQPSPSPPTVPCPNNATYDTSAGACKCDSGFTPAFNGTTLTACITGTNIAQCPNSAPIEVKTLANAPTIVSCITTETPCPAGFTLPLYNGVPSTRRECRPNQGGCNYIGFSMPVTAADNSVIGCLNATTNACPFMDFRSAPNWTLDKCQDVKTCPVFSATSTAYTVPALPANATSATVPLACLTLGTPQACPDVAQLRFPLPVTHNQPGTPPCGTDASPCTNVRTLQCMAHGSSCPSPYTLQLYKNPAGPTSTPVLVECRSTRNSCDLTASGTNPDQNPNAGAYSIEVRTGDALDGCVLAGSTVCPAGYPFPTADAGGVLSSCRTTQTPTSCSSTEAPIYDAAGKITACQLASVPCPNAFPITLRKDTNGNRAGCLPLNSTCPADYSMAMYGFFTALPGVSASKLTITNCWANGVVSSCGNVMLDPASLPAGTGGAYAKMIVASPNGMERTIACLTSSATACPSEYPFSYLDFASSGTSLSVPTTATLDKCAAAGVTSCPSFVAPASGLPTVYYKPGYTRSNLTACIKYYTAPFNTPPGTLPVCPSAYPIVSMTRADPATVTSQDQVAGCYTSDTSCQADSPGTPFSLMPSSSGTGYCVPQIIGLQTCGGYPVAAYQSGLPLFSPDGQTLIGCTATASSCPNLFPVFFRNAAIPPVLQRCQASVAAGSTCSSVSNGAFPVQVEGVNNAIVSCQAASSNCSSSQITLSLTVEGPAAKCSSSTTACTDPEYPIGLYDGSTGNGGKLVRCLPQLNATNCNGAYFGAYNVEVYGGSEAPGNVIGCMRSNLNTLCPIAAPIHYLAQVAPTEAGAAPTFAITQCRAGPPVPNLSIGNATYSIPIRDSGGLQTYGYIASPATTCPTSLVSPYSAAFFLVGTSASSPIEECRQITGSNPTFAAGCAAFLGATPFTVPVAAITNPSNLAGCARTNIANCPFNYTNQYTGNAISGCQSATNCTVAPFTNTIYDATGIQTGCGEDTACNALFPTAKVDMRTADGAASLGCMTSAAAQCPPGFPYSVFSSADGRRPLLTQCWVSSAVPCGSGASPAAASVPIYDVFAQTTKIGCTLPDVNCPDAAPYFRADVADVGTPAVWTGKLTGASPTTNYCFRTAPSQCNGTGIPVRANAVAGDSSAVILGCLNAPAADTADLGATRACPSVLPVTGDYTLYVAIGVSISGPPAVTAGNVVECRRNANDKSCGNLVPIRAFNSPELVGCMSLTGSGSCPATGYTKSQGYDFELWGPSSATDATPRLEACITPPGTGAASYACGNILPGSTYTVPVSTDLLDANVPVVTGANLQGCTRVNTSCPSSFFPLVSSNLQVQACRGARQLASAGCNASYVPVCDMQGGASGAVGVPQITADGTCLGADTLACFAAAGSTYDTCASLTSSSKYPVSVSGAVSSQYKFIVKIQPQGTYTLTACGVASAQATACNVAGTYVNRAYPPGAVQGQANGAFRGCTDGTDDICDAWWGGLSPGGSCS